MPRSMLAAALSVLAFLFFIFEPLCDGVERIALLLRKVGLLVLGKRRNQVNHSSIVYVEVNHANPAALSHAAASPARFPNPAGIFDNRVGLGFTGNKEF